MKLSITTSPAESAEVRKTIERIVRLGLTRFASQLRDVHVALCDHDGPEPGQDQRCVLRIVMPGSPEVVIQEISPNVEQAVSLAVDRAARNIGRVVNRRMRNREYQRRG